MYSKTRLAFKYINYYFTAANGKGHGIHSPFVFHFITKILNDKTVYPEYSKVENLRRLLLKNHTVLTMEDFGAGSTVTKTNARTIATIAKNSAKTKKFGQLLFRMVKAYQPQTILEMGTSLGISSSYLSFAKPDARLITMEGAKEVAAKARENFQVLGLQNYLLIEGNFDNTISTTVTELNSLDFAFIDGNHRKLPTEKYFTELLPKISNNSILIFDDIHWSKEMEQAWDTIKSHPSVRCTIDLFFIGIVIFRQEFREKQHFTIRF